MIEVWNRFEKEKYNTQKFVLGTENK